MIKKPDQPENIAQAEDDDMRIEAGLQQLATAAMTESGLPSRSERMPREPAFALRATARQPSLRCAREGWMEKIRARDGERTVSANELTSLTALIAYVAHNAGASEFRVERELADRFNIANAKCLPASCYDDAIRYLVDRVPAATAV
jgi:hypothetical protein